MASAAIPVRGKGQTTCAHHKGRELEMFCEKCKDLICMKCLSSVHRSHTVCELSEITSQKKQDIENFIDRTEQNDLVAIGKYIASTDTLLKDNDRSFEKLSHQLRMQTEKLKHDLDKLTTETLILFKKMKDDNANLIQKYKHDLDMYDKQLKQQIQRCKAALQQGSHIEIHDTKCVIDSQLHLPSKPVLGTVTVTTNTNPQNHLKQALGKVVTSGQGQTSIEKDPSSDGHLQSCTQHQTGDKGNKAVTRTTLQTEARMVDEWRSPREIWSICPTTDNQAWISNHSDLLTLFNTKSKVIQQQRHMAAIKDISLSPTTHGLWACGIDNIILELVSGKLIQRFRTKEEPQCICVTSSDDVLVGMSRRISKYTTQGRFC
ncbi:uncharacterized protein [Argopecten irradians]|uniref:uncharacterized protein n=1 Tax=Argopecten irradians TaxID=31199 RepID=UPI003720AAD8